MINTKNSLRIKFFIVFGIVLVFGVIVASLSVHAEEDLMVPIGEIKFACYEQVDISKKELKLSEVGRDCVKKEWLAEHAPKKANQKDEIKNDKSDDKTDVDQKSSGIEVEKDKLSQSIGNLIDQLLNIATGESKLKSATSELLAEGGKIKEILNDRNDIYIGIGENVGVRSGMRFEVIRQGEPIKSSGETIGYMEEKIGKVKIVRTRENISIGEIISNKEGKNVSIGDVVYPIKREIKSVGVLLFPHNGDLDQLSQWVNQEVNMSLVENGVEIKIIEDSQKVANGKGKNNVNFSKSQPVSVPSAVKLGKIIDVQTVLTGEIIENAEELVLAAKLIDVNSSRVLSSEKTAISKIAEREDSTGEEQDLDKEKLEVLYRQDFNHMDKGVYSISLNRRNYLKAKELRDLGSLKNFVLEVEAKEAGGSPVGYGILFRRSGRKKFYVFNVSNTGKYKFSKQTSKRWRWENVVNWTKSPYIKKGSKWNHIKVSADGPKIKLYVNGSLLLSIKDSSLKRGNIALITNTGNKHGNVTVLFDNLVVYKRK